MGASIPRDVRVAAEVPLAPRRSRARTALCPPDGTLLYAFIDKKVTRPYGRLVGGPYHTVSKVPWLFALAAWSRRSGRLLVATGSGHLELRDAGRPDLPVVLAHDLTPFEPAPAPAPAWASRW